MSSTEYIAEISTRVDALGGDGVDLQPQPSAWLQPSAFPSPLWEVPTFEELLRFSLGGWIGEPDDPELPHVAAPARLLAPPGVELRLPIRFDDQRRIGAQLGVVELMAADGRLDAIVARRSVANGPCAVLRGPRTRPVHAPSSAFSPILTGRGESWTQDRGRVVIRLRDATLELEQIPAARRRYLGTGLGEGPEELAGQAMPQAEGVCSNVRGQLVDWPSKMFRFSDGQLDVIPELRERAFVLPLDDSVGNAGDFDTPAELAAVATTTLEPGHYATCLAEGVACLHFQNEGAFVTADVVGYGGEANSHADTIARLLAASGWSGAVEAASLAALPDGPAGWHWRGEELEGLTVGEQLEQVLSSLYGWAAARPGGDLAFGLVEPPPATAAGLPALGAAALLGEPELLEPPGLPVWRMEVGYDRNHTVQEGADLVEDLPAAARERWARRWRVDGAAEEQAAVRIRARGTAIEGQMVGGWRLAADARAVARRVVETQGASPRVIALAARTKALMALGLWLGDAVAVDHPRLLLSGGWPARIVGGSQVGERTTLILLGRIP